MRLSREDKKQDPPTDNYKKKKNPLNIRTQLGEK